MSTAPRDNPQASVISHFLPVDVLRSARELSVRFQREEVFRRYVVRRAFIVVPAGFLMVMISAVSTWVVARGVVHIFFTPPIGGWLALLTLGVALVVFFGGFVIQLYLLFFWMGKRAYRKAGIAMAEVVSPAAWVCLVAFVIVPLILSPALPPLPKRQTQDVPQAPLSTTADRYTDPDKYSLAVRNKVALRLRPPPDIPDDTQTVVHLRFSESGEVTDLKIAKSSNIAAYDEAVRLAIARAEPFPILVTSSTGSATPIELVVRAK